MQSIVSFSTMLSLHYVYKKSCFLFCLPVITVSYKLSVSSSKYWCWNSQHVVCAVVNRQLLDGKHTLLFSSSNCKYAACIKMFPVFSKMLALLCQLCVCVCNGFPKRKGGRCPGHLFLLPFSAMTNVLYQRSWWWRWHSINCGMQHNLTNSHAEKPNTWPLSNTHTSGNTTQNFRFCFPLWPDVHRWPGDFFFRTLTSYPSASFSCLIPYIKEAGGCS